MRILVLSLLLCISAIHGVEAQKKKKKKKNDSPTEQAEKPKKEGKMKPYSKVITKEAKTDDGLFKVHSLEDKYYYEIPGNLLNTDMLLVSRIAKLPSGLGGGYVTAGSKSNEQVVQWEKRKDKILLRSVSYYAVADESLPIHQSVQINNYNPIIYAFDIETIGADSSTYVIDVSKFFSSDVDAISGLSSRNRKRYKVSRLDNSRSFIEAIKSFPTNIEVVQEMTYNASEPPSNSDVGSISIVMNQSMILLPEKPMMPREYDPRVGWFTIRQIDYGSEELKADQKRYIRRWRLEPKDPEAYARGELVEPVKPIVYYIDPATPDKWRPYIKQGVEDWQQTFETAGFKNAILAKDPPTKEEDPDWSPEDARYSTVRYVATTTRNAMGPSVSDPRSGEIIESDIVWYHNHLRSYRNRYMLETGAANPSARTLDTPMEDIGEMMRQVIAHEIGHALGLPHNMKSSSAYPVDSLRSATFTNAYGIAPSVMDYARYNYIAQPGDDGVRFIRKIGPYDHYAINWGYRYLPDAQTSSDEAETLDSWIKAHEGDPVYMFGSDYGVVDPSSQTENIGDDPIKASTYGINNLKKVAPELKSWTADKTNDYEDLEELFGELAGVWSRYLGHVTPIIGGVEEVRKNPDQEGVVYQMVPRSRQQEAVNWLLENAFATPDWMVRDEVILNLRNSGYVNAIGRAQERTLFRIVDARKLSRMAEQEILDNSYAPSAMLSQLKSGLFSELRSASSIDVFRRNIQKVYVDELLELTDLEEMDDDMKNTDVPSVAIQALLDLQSDINRYKSRFSGMSRAHLEDLNRRIEQMQADS